MEQREAELVIEWFLDLEERLNKFLKTVPINWNYKAVLPLVSGIIVEAAGLVDSVFRKEFDLFKSYHLGCHMDFPMMDVALLQMLMTEAV